MLYYIFVTLLKFLIAVLITFLVKIVVEQAIFDSARQMVVNIPYFVDFVDMGELAFLCVTFLWLLNKLDKLFKE
jgi:hypothetical protein